MIGKLSKVLTALCHLKDIRGQCTLYIEMRETTQGSGGKVLAYHCKRIHLKKPVTVGDRTYFYTNIIKSVDRVPTEKCKKSHKSSGRMISITSKHRPGQSHKSRHSTKRHSTKKHHKTQRKSLTKRLTNSMKRTAKTIRNSVSRILSKK